MLIPWIDATLSTYHVDGLVKRARHEMRRRLGVYQRTVARPAPRTRLCLPALALEPVQQFFHAHPEAALSAVERGDEVLRGQFRLFGGDCHDVGFPPAWHRHPLTRKPAPRGHWSALSDDGASGDIKWLWEPARFSFAYALSRAFVASGQARYRDAFTVAFADFVRENPPYRGVHWSCGQETAHRLIAIVWASSVFGIPTAAGQERLTQFIYDSGRRIAAALDYALSQRNNHGLSELCGLWLCAGVCPDLPDASGWQSLVRARLPRLLDDQFAADGSYIQESLSYHRTALELLLLLQFFARGFGHEPLPGVTAALRRATRYLLCFADDASGQLPNFGANDGSRVLPLASVEHGDARPTLQLANFLSSGERAYPPGPWDETAAWFGHHLPLDTKLARPRACVFPSGNARSQRGASSVFLRAPEHRHHRPSQADSLHVDVWWQSENLALDPGTYLYSGAPPWGNSLAETRVHNTVSVGDMSQMIRRGRFFWTHWNQAALRLAHDLPGGTIFCASTHADPERRFSHERMLVHSSAGVLVLDRVAGPALAPIRVHWNLLDGFEKIGPGLFQRGPVRFGCEAQPHGRSLSFTADPGSNLGWHAPTYGRKLPCHAVELEVMSASATFAGHFSWSGDPGWDDLCDRLWRRWQDGDDQGARDEAQRALS